MMAAIIGTALGGVLAWGGAMLFERLKKYGEEQGIIAPEKGEEK